MIIVLSFITFKNGSFFNENNKQIVFHGVNLVVKQAPFLPELHTTTINDPYSFSETDAVYLQSNGINLVRIGLNHAALLPECSAINTTYLKQLHYLTNLLYQHDIYVILDFHQDLLVKMACGQGFAACAFHNQIDYFGSYINLNDQCIQSTNHQRGYYAILAAFKQYITPEINYCGNINFSLFYLTNYVNKLFDSLYNLRSYSFLQLEQFWNTISEEFKDDKMMIGYDLINEPFPADIYQKPMQLLFAKKFENKVLQPFYSKLALTIRKNDLNHLIFIEPSVINFFKSGLQLNDSKQILTFHVYCYTVDSNGDVINAKICQNQYYWIYNNRATIVKKNYLPVIISEFGATKASKKGLSALQYETELFSNDSWSYWQYKRYNDQTTVFRGDSEDNEGVVGIVNNDKQRILFHPYIQQFNCTGCQLSQQWNYDSETLQVTLQGDVNVALSCNAMYKLNNIISSCNYQENTTDHIYVFSNCQHNSTTIFHFSPVV